MPAVASAHQRIYAASGIVAPGRTGTHVMKPGSAGVNPEPRPL